MKNVTKLQSWSELQALGFEPIKFKFHGKTVAIGAALRKKLVDISGREFYTDLICIEPHDYTDEKRYHITGDVNTPYTGKFYRYEYGRKVEFFEQVTHINDHFKAADILPTIKKMLA